MRISSQLKVGSLGFTSEALTVFLDPQSETILTKRVSCGNSLRISSYYTSPHCNLEAWVILAFNATERKLPHLRTSVSRLLYFPKYTSRLTRDRGNERKTLGSVSRLVLAQPETNPSQAAFLNSKSVISLTHTATAEDGTSTTFSPPSIGCT